MMAKRRMAKRNQKGRKLSTIYMMRIIGDVSENHHDLKSKKKNQNKLQT